MGDITAVVRTSKGFSVVTNTNLAMEAIGHQEIVLFEDQKTMLILYNDVEFGYEFLNLLKNKIEDMNLVNILEVFQQIDLFYKEEYKDDGNLKLLGVLGCGFEDNIPKVYVYSKSTEFEVTEYQNEITLDRNTIYDFYKELLYPSPSNTESAILFLSVWITKLKAMNPIQNYGCRFATLDYFNGHIYENSDVEKFLTKGNTFHSTIRGENSTLFLGVPN